MKILRIGDSLIAKAGKNEAKKACFQLFEFLNFKNKLKNIDKIFIKPNIVSMQHYTIGSITDPLAVDELIKYIRKFSNKEILIVESETIWKTRKRIEKDEPDYNKNEQLIGFNLSLKSSGIRDIVKKNKNVKVLNITRAKKLDSNRVKNKIAKKFGKKANEVFSEFFKMVPVEFDSKAIFISLSKIKSHCFEDTKVTNCMKNQYGLIAYPDKTVYHHKLSETIQYVNMIAQSFFDCYYITEALRYTMEGGGPTRGDTLKNLGIAVVGRNPVEIDAIAATLMEVNPLKLDYLQSSRGLLGNYNKKILEKIPKSFKYRFRLHPMIEKITRENSVYQ
ncbi:DUF362 domain-containing protein [Candidatus Woesearchaeota archaeon]|nr:DUF362 domain-containing protein [Candidatus Woesearchaeota archaeon]